MTRLDTFALSDMVRCGTVLRGIGSDAKTIGEIADELVSFIYHELVDEATGVHSCALVRLFKTHPYGGLPETLRAVVRDRMDGEPPSPEMKCLTLLATRGEHPEWNSIDESVDHRVIPLPSPLAVKDMPMILRMVEQLGVGVDTLLSGSREHAALAQPIIDAAETKYNVLLIPDASDSPYVPSTDFVQRVKVASVLGFGGMLSTGDLYTILMFCRVRVSRRVANLFRTLALNVTIALEPRAHGPLFSPPESKHG